jgi:hypothetical protein
MANPTYPPRANAPFWNASTTVSIEVLTGGFDAVTVTGYYLIVSNIGANNVWIGPDALNQGILVQPGGSFETAILAGSAFYVLGTIGEAVSVVQYSDA